MQVEPQSILEAAGKLISQRRRERGLTQQDFGKAMGLSRTAIASMESGRTELFLRQLHEIAAILRVEPAALVPRPDTINSDSLQSLLHSELSYQEVELYRAILQFDDEPQDE